MRIVFMGTPDFAVPSLEALVARGVLDHATVRSPLLPLAAGAHDEIATALNKAGLGQARIPALV